MICLSILCVYQSKDVYNYYVRSNQQNNWPIKNGENLKSDKFFFLWIFFNFYYKYKNKIKNCLTQIFYERQKNV